MVEFLPDRTLFVSDLHLRGPSDPNQRRFLEFVEQRVAPDPDAALVIAGDLFDFWFAVGEEVPASCLEVLDRLGALPRVFWLEGNHDIGQSRAFGARGGMKIVDDELSLRCGELLLHVSHGDGIDPSDHGHRLLTALLATSAVRSIAAMFGSARVQRLGGRIAEGNRSRKGGLAGRNRRWLEAAHTDAASRRQTGTDLSVRGHGHFLGWWPNGLVCLGDWLHFHSYLELRPQEPRVALRRFTPERDEDEVLSLGPSGELEWSLLPARSSEFSEHAS